MDQDREPAAGTPGVEGHRFRAASVAGLDEPVRRYLLHAIGDGATVPPGIRLTMVGRIKVGRWLSFEAAQEFRDPAFVWRARAGVGRLKPLHVVDSYRDGAGRTEGRLFGRLRFMHADDRNTARAAAGRAAAESIWVPGTLLPEHGVGWRVEGEDTIVAQFCVPPERPELRFGITDTGAVRSIRLMRWGNMGRKDFDYIPFGGDILAERRFGEFVLPSECSVGWWYGTPRYEPFFEATIVDATPLT
jgi:hypothetical protein